MTAGGAGLAPQSTVGSLAVQDALGSLVRRVQARARWEVKKRRRPAGSMEQWLRIAMNEDVARIITEARPAERSAVEVSGELRADCGWAEYVTLHYPEFDLCASRVGREYDVVICEQVLEHVPDPIAATRTLAALCAPGGTLIVSTPFLVRIHGSPDDFWRFTPDGLERLLSHAGFVEIDVKSWGNWQCVMGNLRRWAPRRPWSSLRNDPDLPMVVWATARRPHDTGTVYTP